MPYKPRADYKPAWADTPVTEMCGAPTKRGTPCKWSKAECPVEWHKNPRPADTETCGALTKAGTPCKWPKDECEYHRGQNSASGGSQSFSGATGGDEADSPFEDEDLPLDEKSPFD